MHNIDFFVVEQDRYMTYAGIAILPPLTMILGWIVIRSSELVSMHLYLFFPFQIITIALFLLFLTGSIGYFIMMFFDNGKPLAIMTPAGIELKYFGFIPWSNVKEFDVTYVVDKPMACITLIPYESSHLPEQASRIGKMAFFWSNITGNPPITIANTVPDLETIVIKAHQLMAEQERTERY